MEYVYDTNIWDLYDTRKYHVLITTNIGWKRDGCNVMGAGIAKDAAKRFPFLPERYGMICKEKKEKTGVILIDDIKLILFPTKQLNPAKPWTSWMNKSSIPLIERCMEQLVDILKYPKITKLVMPLPGAANGGLRVRTSLNIVKKYLAKNPKVILCDWKLK